MVPVAGSWKRCVKKAKIKDTPDTRICDLRVRGSRDGDAMANAAMANGHRPSANGTLETAKSRRQSKDDGLLCADVLPLSFALPGAVCGQQQRVCLSADT